MSTSFSGTHNKVKLEFHTKFLIIFLQPLAKVQILIHDWFWLLLSYLCVCWLLKERWSHNFSPCQCEEQETPKRQISWGKPPNTKPRSKDFGQDTSSVRGNSSIQWIIKSWDVPTRQPHYFFLKVLNS